MNVDHATIAQALCGIAGLGVGTIIGGVLRRGKVSRLEGDALIREGTIDGLKDRITDLGEQLSGADKANEALVALNADIARKHGRAQAEIVELKPLAEKGRQAIERQKALARAGNKASHAAKAAKKAAAASANVEPIRKPGRVTAPKKPTRKSALAR